MSVPYQLVQWVQRSYPRPQVHPGWLEQCYEYILENLKLDPSTDLQNIIHNVEAQFLQSDLQDSTVPGTGLPPDIFTYDGMRLQGPILVQISAITDIGQSAFSLQNVRQTRLDRADLAGLGQEGDEDEGPIPRYPRSMLRFQLSDGNLSIKAVEYRKLPQLELGETPLGYKMVLQNVLFRRGIAFLEPSTVVLRGHQVAELEEKQDENFVRGIRLRMGLEDAPESQGGNLDADRPVGDQSASFQVAADVHPEPQARPIAGPANVPRINVLRNPLGTMSAAALDPDSEDDERRRKAPRLPHAEAARPSEGQASRYFAQGSSSSGQNPCANLASEHFLSSPGASSSRPPTDYAAHIPPDDNDPGAGRMPSSDGFDDDSFELDEAALEHLSQVERNAARALGLGPPSILDFSSTGSTSDAARIVDTDVIEIDDDEEEKENVPMPSRRVRLRTQAQDDVIDISD